MQDVSPILKYYGFNGNESMKNPPNKTISAISTPAGPGGVGLIRISGKDAISIAQKVFTSKSGRQLAEMKGYTAAYGEMHDSQGQLDDGIALVFRAPKSYTGEDMVELTCHGGGFVTQSVLRATYEAGAVAAGPGEFTRRAYINDKMDLAQAESVMNIISASGRNALTAAKMAHDGNLSRLCDSMADELQTLAALITAWTEYPDEDIDMFSTESVIEKLTVIRKNLLELVKRYDTGKSVTEGVNTVICGRPNVGKSSVMNMLAGKYLAIVTDIPGTTRDVVSMSVRAGQVLLHLSDTAGMHDTDDKIESIGIDLARQKAETAELILAVFDGSEKLTEEDYKLIDSVCRDKNVIAVVNKMDLPQLIERDFIEKNFRYTVSTNATDDFPPDSLYEMIEKAVGADNFDPYSEMLAGERQRMCCIEAAESLNEAILTLRDGMTFDTVEVCIESALSMLFELTGKSAREEIVASVFKNFCLGK